MSDRRILVAFAHPDDESFGLGGLIAKYVDEGVDVYYLCATNGDVGTIDVEHLNGYQSHAECRLSELDCAAKLLGLKEVIQMNYTDSGMMGNPDNENPDCLWYRWQHEPEAVTRRVVGVIRDVKPQVVLTFNRYGGYGHPDHIAIQQATTQAFKLAADETHLTDGQAPYAPQKLYYTRFPTIDLRIRIWSMMFKGKNPREAGRNKDINLMKILANIEPAHCVVDVKPYFQIWREASACHVSQGGANRPDGLIEKTMRFFNGVKNELTRVYPEPQEDRIDEYDVFTNVITAQQQVRPVP